MVTSVARPVPVASEQYGSFVERFLAVLIDGILIAVAMVIIRIPLGMVVGSLMASIILLPINLVAAIVYETYFLSSPKQATIGKQVMGLIVTDANGAALDMTKAAIRSVGKIVSTVVLCLGYIMALFTPRNQALHDMIAGTVVVKGKRG